MIRHRLIFKNQKGYIAIVSVLLLGIVTILIAISVVLMSIDNAMTVSALNDSNRARDLSRACAEVAMNNLRSSLSYAGNETITIDSNACHILSVLGTGNTSRTIQTDSTVGKSTQRMRIIISQVTPATVISSWQEVPTLP
ncbi:MAG: hypothetical protein WCJ19_03650 [bacterium]